MSLDGIRTVLTTHQKALALNLNRSQYGTIAEIGAGQEVARWFFRVGGASGTVALAISAYDKTFSDSFYGSGERYVSRPRLERMLEREYSSLLERLTSRQADTTFFAFADTVVARSYSRPEDGQGWLGIRFQTAPGAAPSQIVIHVRLFDKDGAQQQETLGILGVNLIYGAMFLTPKKSEGPDPVPTGPDDLIRSLLDNLSRDRAEVNLIDLSGPGFEGVDHRVMSLKLVEEGLTDAAMFLANGQVVPAADALYKKAILVERGSFRPVTITNIDILNCSLAQFSQEPQVQHTEIMILAEMNLSSLTRDGQGNYQDFLERVDTLGTLGKNVLITNFFTFHRLAAYLFRYTKAMIGVCIGLPTLREVFEEKYYEDLEGGILESFGRLFKNDLKLYAYPTRENGAIISAGNLRVAPHLRHLYAYLLENRLIEGLRGYDERCLDVRAAGVLERIQNGDSTWEEMVPPIVAHRIMEHKLFGYAGPQPPAREEYLRRRHVAGRKASPSAEPTPAIDEAQLREAASGDVSLAVELLAGFRDEVAGQLRTLGPLLDKANAAEIREVARSIRGTASTMGFLEVRSLMLEVEEAAKAGDVNQCRSKLAFLPPALDRLKASLDGLTWG